MAEKDNRYNSKMPVLSFRVPKDIDDGLRRICADKNLSRNTYLYDMLRNHLVREGYLTIDYTINI